MKLKEKDKAPYFKLSDQDGKARQLSDFRGELLLLYFYPRDNTPGCTKEACSFRDSYTKLKRAINIVGVSSNSVESHKKFAEKHKLPFPLLSDVDKKTIEEYGVNGVILPKRTSFLINKKGIIRKIYEKVDPANHAGEIIEDIKKYK